MGRYGLFVSWGGVAGAESLGLYGRNGRNSTIVIGQFVIFCGPHREES